MRLTPNEISGLTKWEGTKWAKERYERENNCIIRDTAADTMPVWNPRDPNTRRQMHHSSPPTEDSQLTTDESMNEFDDEDSEGELESVGVALNERLRERLAARDAGDTTLPLDEAWEQYFKNLVETGEIGSVRDSLRERERMVDRGRAGHWEAIPEALQNMVRDVLQAEMRDRLERPGFSPLPPSLESVNLPALASARLQTTSSQSGLRIPDSFQRLGDGGTSHGRRTNA